MKFNIPVHQIHAVQMRNALKKAVLEHANACQNITVIHIVVVDHNAL